MADIWMLLLEPGAATPRPGTRISYELKQLPIDRKAEYAFGLACLVFKASELRALANAQLMVRREVSAAVTQYGGEHSAQIDWEQRAEQLLKSAQPEVSKDRMSPVGVRLEPRSAEQKQVAAARAVQVIPVLPPLALQSKDMTTWQLLSGSAAAKLAQPWLAPGGVQVIGTQIVPWYDLPADALEPGRLARKRSVRPGVEILPTGEQRQDKLSQDEIADTRTALRLDYAPVPAGEPVDVNAPGIDQGRFGDVELAAAPEPALSVEDELASVRQRLQALDRRLSR